jgi:hypothetical protein
MQRADVTTRHARAARRRDDRMMNDEGRMMNEKQSASIHHSSFCLHHLTGTIGRAFASNLSS